MQLETGQFQDGLGEQPSHREKVVDTNEAHLYSTSPREISWKTQSTTCSIRTFILFSVMNNSRPLEIFHLDIFDSLINRTFPDFLFLKQPRQ